MDDALNRRAALKTIGGALLAVSAGLAAVCEAAAGITWCRSDPYVVIDGTHLNVFAERDQYAQNRCTGPVRMVFTVPVGVSTQVLSQDNGFGFGYDVRFQQDPAMKGKQYQVDMYVPASSSTMDVRLSCIPVDPSSKPTSKVGTANRWLTVITKV